MERSCHEIFGCETIHLFHFDLENSAQTSIFAKMFLVADGVVSCCKELGDLGNDSTTFEWIGVNL